MGLKQLEDTVSVLRPRLLEIYEERVKNTGSMSFPEFAAELDLGTDFPFHRMHITQDWNGWTHDVQVWYVESKDRCHLVLQLSISKEGVHGIRCPGPYADAETHLVKAVQAANDLEEGWQSMLITRQDGKITSRVQPYPSFHHCPVLEREMTEEEGEFISSLVPMPEEDSK